MEDLRNTEEYRKAYKRADRICRYMPSQISKVYSPQGESPAQKQAFEDRIAEYKIEMDSMGKMSRKAWMKKYGTKLLRYDEKKMREKGRGRSRD